MPYLAYDVTLTRDGQPVDGFSFTERINLEDRRYAADEPAGVLNSWLTAAVVAMNADPAENKARYALELREHGSDNTTAFVFPRDGAVQTKCTLQDGPAYARR